jgi:predicted transcriptional regulator of viral defense system
VPIQRIVWTGQGVKVYDPEPANAEICELFSGRNGVSARIVKVTYQITQQPGGKQQEIITREETTFSKRIDEPPIETTVQVGREVIDLARTA